MKHIEDRIFNHDLQKHLDSEVEAECRAEAVEAYATSLTRPGAEFYPWTRAHFEEALGNAPEAAQQVVWAATTSAVELGLNNEYSNHLALTTIRSLVENYWKEIALHDAAAHLRNQP